MEETADDPFQATKELHHDRPNGFLTKTDRQFLLDEKDYTEGSRENKKSDIRRRFRNAILDFHLLAGEYGLYLLEPVFEDLEGELSGEFSIENAPDFYTGLVAFQKMIAASLYLIEGDHDPYRMAVEMGFAWGLQDQDMWVDYYRDVRASLLVFDEGNVQVHAVADRFLEGTLISRNALMSLARSGWLSMENVNEYIDTLSAEKRLKMEIVDSQLMPTLTHPDEVEFSVEGDWTQQGLIDAVEEGELTVEEAYEHVGPPEKATPPKA